MAKKVGLSFEELSLLDVGQVMDYITEYSNNETKAQSDDQSTTKRANQSDFDAF